MANNKQGLAYYNVDTDRYSDRRIKRLKKAFGGIGIAVYDYVLCEVYRDKGCVLEWDEDTAFDVADYFGLKETTVLEIVKYCGSVGLFSSTLLSRGIVTSASIQRRYLDMCARAKRKDIKIPEQWLILPEESPKIPEESSFTTEVCDKVKKSKEKKIKENNLSLISLAENGENDSASQREKDVFYCIFFFKNSKDPKAEVERFVNHYEAQGWCRSGNPVKDKIALAKSWEPKDVGRFSTQLLSNIKSLYDAIVLQFDASSAIRFLSGIEAIAVDQMYIQLKVSEELKTYLISNADFFNREFFFKYYAQKKIIWR